MQRRGLRGHKRSGSQMESYKLRGVKWKGVMARGAYKVWGQACFPGSNPERLQALRLAPSQDSLTRVGPRDCAHWLGCISSRWEVDVILAALAMHTPAAGCAHPV